jgi:cellulose synthase/poly-beta-1,6-N-acetylglucosamine synthase-like glycosyltransferase
LSLPTTKTITAVASCFRGEKYLPAFLDSCAAQTIAGETEILLVHNDPSDAERRLVTAFAAEHPGLLTHLVVPREALAVSTNRALASAQGRYVTIWNVDDLRTADSLELCARTLDEHPEIGFTYGDFVLVDKFEETAGPRVRVPSFDRREFTRSMHLGPFYMWRRSLCEEFGYWDEQLRMGGDFDYAIRLALASDGRKTDGVLGYYLNEGLGLSTSAASLQPVEGAVLALRYGALDKVDLAFYWAARRYRLNDVRLGDRWIPLRDIAPQKDRYARSRAWLAVAAWRSATRPPLASRLIASCRVTLRPPAPASAREL